MKHQLFIFSIISLFLLPTQTYAGGLNVPTNLKLDKVECGEAPKAYAYFSWSPVDFATSYRFYIRTTDQPFTSFDETTATSYKVGFNPEFDFKMAVSSVNTFTGTNPTYQVLESDKSQEATLSARDLIASCKTEALTGMPIGISSTPTIPTPTIQPKTRQFVVPTATPTPAKVLQAKDIEISEYAASPSAVTTRPTTEEMFGNLFTWLKKRLPFLH